MMILKILSDDQRLLHTIADDLLQESLIANAVISELSSYKQVDDHGAIIENGRSILNGISKSLLFNKINMRLRDAYGQNMPLIYSEPLIMMDSLQMEEILSKLQEV